MNIPIDKLTDLLGTENTEALKKRIAYMIGDRIQEDLEQYDKYIFYPPDYQGFFDECFEEAKTMVKEAIVQKLYGDMMNAYQTKSDK